MAISWSRQNLYIPFICSIVYLTVVLGVQRYMRDRPPINVQVYAMVWSSTMAVFNIGAAVRMAPALFDAINQNGWINSLCYFCDKDDNNNNDRGQSPLKFWTFCCIFIKLYEMTNTLFIVLSKRNLSFPHVFHHIHYPCIRGTLTRRSSACASGWRRWTTRSMASGIFSTHSEQCEFGNQPYRFWSWVCWRLVRFLVNVFSLHK